MPLEVILDEQTKSSFEADTQGIRYLQAGVAKNIPETDPGKLLARIPTLAGVPGVGTPHKIYGQALVTGYRVTGIGDFDVNFVVVYESPGGLGLNFLTGQWYAFRNNSIQQEETWLDYLNNPIKVRYQMPGSGKSVERLGSARRFFATTDMTLTGVFNEDLTDAQNAAVGCINFRPWYGKKKATWLCTGAISRPEIFGLTWRKTATFSWNPKTWDAYEKFIDPHTGQAPVDISQDDVSELVNMDMTDSQENRNGVTRARVNDLADFEVGFGNQ